jgi:hypothetical protein
LASVLPNFRGLPAGRPQTHALLEVLRKLTTQLRGETAQPFYSTREVAQFFGVPQPTVVQVFAELEVEGRLVRLRSVGTLLQGSKRQPRVPVRGVVGLPIWQWGFCHLAEWRQFYLRIEECLARHHLVADFIFFSEEIHDQEQFLERLLSHNLDYVLWYKPLLAYKSMLLTLRDGGVSVVAIVDQNIRLPVPTYRLDVERAVLKALQAWRAAGRRETVVLHSAHAQVALLSQLVTQAGLTCETIATSEESFAGVVARLEQRPQRGVILCDETLACHLCYRQPDQVARLLRQHRVLMWSLFNADPRQFAGCQVDMVHINWDRLAARIADDLASGRYREIAAPVVLPAVLHAGAEASRFAKAY